MTCHECILPTRKAVLNTYENREVLGVSWTSGRSTRSAVILRRVGRALDDDTIHHKHSTTRSVSALLSHASQRHDDTIHHTSAQELLDSDRRTMRMCLFCIFGIKTPTLFVLNKCVV